MKDPKNHKHEATAAQPCDSTEAHTVLADGQVICVSRECYEQLSQAQAQAQQLAQKLTEANEKYLRLAAEMENLKKRLLREKDDARRYANEAFAESIVAAMDNFELGIQAAVKADNTTAIAEGMKLALMQLTNALANHGLTPVDAEGKPFDPNLHEAVSQEECADVPDHTVVRQLRRGWKYYDRLLRPASVVVSCQPATANHT